MAKGKYHEWRKPEKLFLIRMWRRDGLTIEQTARAIGVNPDTLYKWMKRFPEIDEALKTGKDEANAIIENKLYQRALTGNMTAIIFYLKNNWRDKYNDSQLSPEERELAKERTRKLRADTKNAETELEIKRAKLKILQSEGVNAEDHLLKLIETIEREDEREHDTE